MGGIIDQGLQTLMKTYKVAGSMGGGGTEPLMQNAVKLPNGGTEGEAAGTANFKSSIRYVVLLLSLLF